MKILLIILVVVLGIRLFIRFILPLLGRFAIKKATENIQEQTKRKTRGEKVFEKGDLEIRKPNKKKSAGNDPDDDYVDYTEV